MGLTGRIQTPLRAQARQTHEGCRQGGRTEHAAPRCSRSPLPGPSASGKRCTHARVHPLPVFACFAENPSVPARHSTRTSPPPSIDAQDRDALAVEARTLGWEAPRDKSRLLDQYARSLMNSRIPSLHRIPPAMQQRASPSSRAGGSCGARAAEGAGGMAQDHRSRSAAACRNRARFPLLRHRTTTKEGMTTFCGL